MREKTADGDEHKQFTMRRNEYNATTIARHDLIKQPDYNLFCILSQNSLNLSHKSKIVETEYSISISY